MPIDPLLTRDLKKTELHYVHDGQQGYTRKGHGTGFTYYDTDGNRIESEQILKRIIGLAIPPAWTDVWISPSPSGYLQATGLDDKKRKQYIYHADWEAYSQEKKFNKLIAFGHVLPAIRRKVVRDMEIDELVRDRIIATVIWLLERTLIRIGNDEYAKENNSFGLTTLRMHHVTVHGKQITFAFRGKSGVDQTIHLSHPGIAQTIRDCSELPGYEVFQYFDDEGNRRTIDSSDVNEYLQAVTKADITAKDFRTWGATVLSAKSLYTLGEFTDKQEAIHKITEAVKNVAKHLHNTAAVCKNYYIHPTIISSYQGRELIPHFNRVFAQYEPAGSELPRTEHATHTLLRKYS